MGDWICPRCRWVNRGFADRCLGCGDARDANALPAPPPEAQEAEPVEPSGGWPGTPEGPRAATDPMLAPSGPMMAPSGPMLAPGGPMLAPADPMMTPTGQMAPAVPATPAGAAQLATGLMVGLLAAAASAAVWYAVVVFSNIQFGLLAAGIGWLVGTATVLGAGGRGSLILAAGSTVFTLLALAVSEYLIIFHFVTEEIGVGLDVIQSPEFMVQVVAESLAADPITLLFWGIAIVSAAWIPFKAINSPA